MRPDVLLNLVFAAVALVALALAGLAVGALLRAGAANANMLLVIGVLLAGFLFALAAAWAVLYARLARPVIALTREIETRSGVRETRPLEVSRDHALGGLIEAAHDLLVRFAAAGREGEKAAADAAAKDETHRRRLEAILLDLSEGVIVCNLDNRILLYNQAAVRILGRPQALGLGRRLFALFERGPVLEAMEALTAQQRADATRKLHKRRRILCTRRDGGEPLEARLALVCSDAVETEGYVLTFTGSEAAGEETESLPPRPEFYDFDLFKHRPDAAVTEIPLKALRCVVFDTETTGLEPSRGDELIAIGAVRVVNGRVITGETFEQLIDPGREIPASSTRFHGLSEADVKGRPGADAVLSRFHAFAGRAVLVAHNAAFDMKFLELKEREAGVSFDNPVLDILLLSAFLHDHASDHTLEAVASRFVVEVTGRHTALGDAITAARIFVAMLEPLHRRGVVTLGDAFEVSGRMAFLRRQQARF